MTDTEINEAVVRKIKKIPKRYGEPNEVGGCLYGHVSFPNYCASIEAVWELTKSVPFRVFDHWPTPKEICEEFLKLP